MGSWCNLCVLCWGALELSCGQSRLREEFKQEVDLTYVFDSLLGWLRKTTWETILIVAQEVRGDCKYRMEIKIDTS